jgi:MoaA/NifB/PqqE/SkfB family radical SAM enzyme
MDAYLARKQANFRRVIASFGKTDAKAKMDARPLLLHLEITSRCNLRCLKCGHATLPRDSPRIQPRHLSYAIVESFDEYFATCARVHTFGLGEMFLYGKLRRLVERIKHFGCTVDGITNGTLVGRDEVDWLVELGYDEITFSIDGAERETMERLRGADLDKILDTLAYLKKRKEEGGCERPRVVVNFVAQADNIHELPALVRKLAGLNIFFLGVNALMRPSGTEDGDTRYAKLYAESSLARKPRRLVEDAIQEARSLAVQAGMSFAVYIDFDALYHPGQFTGLVQLIRAEDENKPAPEKLAPYYCAYPWTSTFVHANAGARICCFMKGTLGTVNDADDFDRVWNTGLITEIRDAVSRGEVHQSCAPCVSRGRYQHSYVDLKSVGEILGVNSPDGGRPDASAELQALDA